MYACKTCVATVMTTAFLVAAAPAAPAQFHVPLQAQSWLPADPARELFNTGQKFLDESRYAEAEKQFREVVNKFAKSPYADRAEYYLIRTLAQVGKKEEALGRITRFPRVHPGSKWLTDVQELRIQLTNEIPARAEAILLTRGPAAPTAAPTAAQAPGSAPAVQVNTGRGYATVRAPFPSLPAAAIPGIGEFQLHDPEVSLQQEIMRAMFRQNTDRAIQIAGELLKINPANPVVLSSLNLVAATPSPQATSILLTIAKDGSNPKARRDAIFWLGQSRGDSTVDTLVTLLPSLAEEDSEAVTYTLSQIRSEKSLGALAAIARDKAKSEKVRSSAVMWIGQTRVPNRVGLLEDVYKNCMDSTSIREQAMLALSQTRESQARTVLGNIASSDPDAELRRKAFILLQRNQSPLQIFQRTIQRPSPQHGTEQ
jgi:tetratricopeptide (TPR) repeat protein